jgi:hypothetical protein
MCTSCWLFLPDAALAQYTQTNRSIATGPNSGGFIEMLPPNYSKNTTTKYPLMIFLEGEGQMGNGSSDLSLLLAAGPPQINAAGQWPDSFVVNKKAYSFVIITPQFKAWPNNGDIDSVMQYALKHYRVDTGRIYMTGTSMGGNCIWTYASVPANAQMLAAIMPVASGEMWTGMQGATSIAQADLPVYATTNVYDPNEPDTLTLNDIAEINSVVPQIKPIALDTVYADSGHDAWTKTYYTGTYLYHGLNCYQWMLQYSRDPGDTISTPPPPPPTVTFSSFTATLTDNNTEVAVAWTTSVERGNRYFIVERSTDSVNFVNLDTAASTAAQGGGASYRYTDPAPPSGNDYYRLVSVDTTGNSTFYSIVKVVVPKPATPPPPPLVTLSAYTAKLMPNNEVSVAWGTSVERGNSYFVVQRSTDSVTFTNLYNAASTASQGGGASYQYTDATPPYGNVYYRLISVDTAGALTYFAVLKVNVPAPPLVQLSAYTATVTDSGKEVTVNWTTSLERQNQYFLVERSTDSVNFTNLAAISSTAPYGGGASYSYTDISPVAGNDYYRLVSVDSAGEDSVFPVLVVQVPAASETVSAVGPVGLTAYTATVIDNGQTVNVLWSTASELGNKDFVVQRSTDSVTFTNLDTVAATGTATSGANYGYTDNAPAPGYNYYRLQRFDVDGDDTLYRILRVQAAGKWVSLPVPSLSLTVSPNPATGLVYLQLVDSIQGTLQVSLTDMAGRVLQVSEFQKVGPVWDQTIDVSMLPRGVYVLQVRGMTTRAVQTILKE